MTRTENEPVGPAVFTAPDHEDWCPYGQMNVPLPCRKCGAE